MTALAHHRTAKKKWGINMTYALTGILSELSRDIPPDIPPRFLFRRGKPLFAAFGCVLTERDTGGNYVYMAVNVKSGKSEELCRRAKQLTVSDEMDMLERIRLSSVAGASRLSVDKDYEESLPYAKLSQIQDVIFRDILPEHGFSVREEQIALANHVFKAIAGRHVTLAEAEVGTGKTLAYLVPAILSKRGRMNDFWNYGLYPGKGYIEYTHSPVVVSTSSIALQKALMRDYIPQISKILLNHGIIKTPLTSAIRKGKKHYICDHNLRTYVQFETNTEVRQFLETLLESSASIDLDEKDGLSAYIKGKICIPKRCGKNCELYCTCRYHRFREHVQNPKIDIQVCNHNFLLADTKRRTYGKKPLLPDYQCLIIDEGHKLLSSARQLYGMEFSGRELPDFLDDVRSFNFRSAIFQSKLIREAEKLIEQNERLFSHLIGSIVPDDFSDEAERFRYETDDETSRYLLNIQIIIESILNNLETSSDSDGGKRDQMIASLENIKNMAATFANSENLICWLEAPREDFAPGKQTNALLRAIPKDISESLRRGLFVRGLPVILTSGTLSANGDFAHIKRTLGLESMFRLTETSKASPFDYRQNSLLYLSENTPFPDNKNDDYISAVTDEVGRLIKAAHGHTAVLFTSYKVMDKVFERLMSRGPSYPVFLLNKGGINAIDQFKKSKGGVLFASGSLWEGIDISGDALSMLIIVKLPFAVPDPIGEYEQTLYNGTNEYKRRVVEPDMLIKLKQGFGRLIRKESDTGVVAILDSRVNLQGIYRKQVLSALPDCTVTAKIKDIEKFLLEKKSAEYFSNIFFQQVEESAVGY